MVYNYTCLNAFRVFSTRKCIFYKVHQPRLWIAKSSDILNSFSDVLFVHGVIFFTCLSGFNGVLKVLVG